MDIPVTKIEELVSCILEHTWFDFIDSYAAEYGIILNEKNSSEVYDAAQEEGKHIFSKAIQVSKWLNELEK